jgi:xyloglucan-specific exo-beta-1,4-glucanase
MNILNNSFMKTKNLFSNRVIVSLLLICFCNSLSKLSAQKYTWQNLPIGGGGFVSGLFPNKTEKDLLYARTDVGGAYRWNAKDSTWIPLLDWVSLDEMGFLGVESMATDDKNPNRVYMLAGMSYFNAGRTAILKSEDYGKTFKIIETSAMFKAHGNGIGRSSGEKLAIDPNNSDILFCGTRWNGLFKSTDAGNSWKRVSGLPVTSTPNENGISFVTFDPSSAADGKTKIIYVGISRYGKNLYKSIDGGESFTLIEAGLPTRQMPARGLFTNNGNLYMTYGNGAGPHGHWAVPEPMDSGSVWRFDTKTGVAKNITPPGYTRPFGGISVDPKDPNRLVLSTMNTWMLQHDNAYGDRVFLTKDGGDNWRDLFAKGMKTDPNGVTWVTNSAIHWTGSIEFDPFNTKVVWITSGNGVYRTSDIEAEEQVWQFQVKGFEEVVPIDMYSIKNGPLISVILDYDGYTHEDVFNYAPAHNPMMGSTHGLDYARLNPEIRLRAGEKMFYTLDGGKLWTEITTKRGKQGRVAVSADGTTFLYFPEKGSGGYWSADLGKTWKIIAGVQMADAMPVADPVNPNKFYIYNSGGSILASTDGGRSFKPAGEYNTTCMGGSKVMRAVPEREGDLWIPLFNGGLARTKDGGTTISTIKKVSYCGAVGFGKEAPGSKFPTIFIWGTIGGVTGIHRSIDEGKTWVRVNDDEHEYGGPANGAFIVGDMNTFGRVYMSTAGRGIVMGNEIK